MPREKLSDELAEWITQIESYLAEYEESHVVQTELFRIRDAMERLRAFLTTEEGA